MARAAHIERIEEKAPASGSLLLVLVGLGVVFLLITALLGIAKSHQPVFTESNLLYAALIFYAGAGALYMGFGVTGTERYVKYASLFTVIGWLANTAAAGHRWYASGRPPFASIYEMLLSFVWTVALLTLIAEKKYGVRIVGSITMPLAVVSVILMQLLPSEVRPLVPALQSTWLHVHVTLAMLSYAACAVSFAIATMFLIQDDFKTEGFQFWTAALSSATFVSIIATRFRGGALSVAGWDIEHKQDAMERGVRYFVNIPDLGWLFVLAAMASLIPLALNAFAYIKKNQEAYGWADKGMFISILLQAATLGAFILRARQGTYLTEEGIAIPTVLAASPFILGGIISSIFASLLYLMLLWRRTDLQRMLPSADTLDRVTYKTICIAFPLLTGMIAAGAYWANRTWGSYWSWDPKEDWAAITWLIYAAYLHMRITRGWRGRRAAYFAIFGFAVVIFTFLGVTYLLPGLHAYA
ncbi:MAG TPA: cytochrome c biogenesis protein CcsA [Candidatus Koribacter sp.]|jgi:cytochrome c-type biogenesis protein CcsB